MLRKIFSLIVLSLALVMFWVPMKNALALTPYDYPTGFRNAIRQYNDGCGGNPNKYMLIDWLSPEGQPTTNAVRVPYGATSINLWYNTSVFTCYQLINVDGRTYPDPLPNDGNHKPPGSPASNLRENRNFISSISVSPGDGGFNPNPVGNTAVSVFDDNTRYWFGGPIFFTYRPNSPLTASRTITVTMGIKGVNRFASGSYICTANGQQTTFQNFTTQCPTGFVNFTILIEVDPPDACPNIPGHQNSVPPGYIKDGAGNCIRDYTHVIDVYPNRPQAYAGETFSVFGDVRNVGSSSSTFVEQAIFGDGNAFSSLIFLNPDGTNAANRYIYWSQGGCSSGGGVCTQRELRFQVDPNLPSTRFACFEGHVQPHRENNFGPYVDPFSNNCIRLVAPRRPYFSTYGGDLHAGGVTAVSTSPVCADLSPGRNKSITGRVFSDRGSRSQIATSATDFISSFGSNNSPTDSSLAFGNVGGNGFLDRVVCRPDFSRLPTTATLVGNTQDVATLATNYDGQVVLWQNNGIKTLNGGDIPAGRSVTVVSEGPVLISGDIRYLGADDSPDYGSRSDIPAFALISRGNIAVNQNVTRLNGLYISNGTFSTCSDNPGLPSPSIVDAGNTDCSNRLVVFGMVVANEILFRRIAGDANAVGVAPPASDDHINAAEIFRLPAEFFLAPPPGFVDLARALRFKSDLPPLF